MSHVLPCACHSACSMIALACSFPTLESLEHLKVQTHHFQIRPIVQEDIQPPINILFMFIFGGQEQQWKKCSYLKDRASNENFDLRHIKLLTYSTSLSRSRSTFKKSVPALLFFPARCSSPFSIPSCWHWVVPVQIKHSADKLNSQIFDIWLYLLEKLGGHITDIWLQMLKLSGGCVQIKHSADFSFWSLERICRYM